MDKELSILEHDARAVLAAVDLGELAGKQLLLSGASGLLGICILASLREFARASGAELGVTAVVHSAPDGTLQALMDFPGARVVRGDLSDAGFIASLGRYDHIIHAAGYAQPGRFMEDRVKTIHINTTATLGLLERLKEDGHFLFVSSSEVYSGLPSPPFRETQIGTSNTTHPRACYIEGKRCGEAICNAYRARGVQASSARLSLAYGPGTRLGDRRVMHSFIERGLTQGRITLQDLGAARRTYCYVTDAVELLLNILLRAKEPIYNVGGTSRTTIAELALRVGEYLGVPVQFPDEVQEMGGAPEDVRLDMSLAARDFDKTVYLPFEEGLARTIEWQRAILGRG